MIFVRSRRSTVLLALATCAVAGGLVGATFWALSAGNAVQATLLGLGAVFAAAFVVRDGNRLRRWPLARIAFFKDGLVVRSGRTELRAPWEGVELATLAEPNEWTELQWPRVRVGDRLTVRMRGGGSFRLHPAAFGLDPVACRDLVLRLRDEPAAREGLPEFDSELDMDARRPAVGELMKPRL